MSVRLRINLVLLAVGVPILVIAALLIAGAASDAARQAAVRSATLLTAEADATARYTADKVTPLVSPDGRPALVFVPAAAPFYAVQNEADLLAQRLPGYTLRRVVLDPVGDGDRPDAFERTAIARLRAEHDPRPFTIERRDASGAHLVLVTPLSFSPGVCATCYRSRADAPPGILDAFGGVGGFDDRPGEIVGVTVASVPLASDAAQVWRGIAVLVGFALVLVLAMNAALEALVLRPLRRVAAVADEVSLGHSGVAEFEPARRDEIGAVTRAFNRLRRSMESAIMLVDT